MNKRIFAIILTVCLVLNMVPALTFAVVTPTELLTSDGATDYLIGGSPVVVDSGLTLTGFTGNIDGATISINNFKTGDALSYPTKIGNIIGSFNSTTGILTLTNSDSPENYQLALRSIKFSTTSIDNSDRTIDITIGNGLYLKATGHFYEFVNVGTPIAWGTAKTSSESRNLYGRKGYLVTITSEAENNFIQLKALGIGWIGARDYGRNLLNGIENEPGSSGDWRWATGPEMGTPFWSGYEDGSVVGVMYQNWDRTIDTEPNDYDGNEWVAHIYSTTGKWNDFNPTNIEVQGFIVEYGGMLDDTPAKITASKVINISSMTSEAKWGLASADGSAPTSWLYGTLANAVTYANGLTSGTAYIRVLADVTTPSALTFGSEGKNTILDLNGKILKRDTNDAVNAPAILVSSGELKIDDTSDSKQGMIASTYVTNNTSGVKITGGTVNFYNGRIISPGQAIYIDGGTFNMYGGQLIGLWNTGDIAVNEAIVADRGVFNIYGGYLTGNKAFWGDSVFGKVYGGYFSDDSISSFVDIKYAMGDLSKKSLPDAIIPAITIGGTTYGPYTLSKLVYLKPTVSSVNVPSNGTYITGQNLDFTVNFNEAVTVNTLGGTPYIKLTLNTGNVVNASFISGNETSSLKFRYTVVAGNDDSDGITVGSSIYANGGTLKDSAENNVDLTLNNIGATTGVLVDAIAPTVNTISPSDDSTNVDLSTNFVITFNENVIKGTGNIYIKKASDNSILETIDVASGKITGEGTTIITVNPTTSLTSGTNYYIQIDETAFEDTAGNSYSGISDAISWSFKTIAKSSPDVIEETTPSAPVSGVVNVVVNGKVENLGKETKSNEAGKSTVTVTLNNQTIESKINEAVKNQIVGANNLVQVMITDTKSEVSKVELTGNVIKKLEENAFDFSIKRENVEYIIPAEEFTISKVASTFGVLEKDLKDIKVEVQIAKLDEATVSKYNEVAKAAGIDILFPPVAFEVVATTKKADGTVEKIEINKFSNYVERIMEIPSGVDVTKVTTGIVFNSDGTYSHVPTAVFQKDGKWYAKLNSLTNSNYSVIWNPIIVKSVENHWSKDAVNDLASRLIIYNPKTFNPQKFITRADFAEYVVRALGLYKVGSTHENKFTDVNENGVRTLAILIANEYGIVSGYQDGTFRPNALITREEAMTMYQKAMKITNLTGSDPNRYQKYSDYSLVSVWAGSYVKDVLSAHVFNGTSTTNISPKDTLTYAEAAQAIKNLLVESELINK